MTKYIIGIVIGSFVIMPFLIYYIFLTCKNFSQKKLVKEIGQSAKNKINADLKIWAKHTKNKFLPASLYKYGENKVFKVDSILVTSAAIIVVEIKSIKGGVRGKGSDPKWLKILDDKIFYITNPIIQNDKHIDHIIRMTNIKVPTISLIIFSNRIEYLDIQSIPPHAIAIRHIDLFHKLDEIHTTLLPRLSTNDIKNLTNAIKSYCSNVFKSKKLHKKITVGGEQWK